MIPRPLLSHLGNNCCRASYGLASWTSHGRRCGGRTCSSGTSLSMPSCMTPSAIYCLTTLVAWQTAASGVCSAARTPTIPFRRIPPGCCEQCALLQDVVSILISANGLMALPNTKGQIFLATRCDVYDTVPVPAFIQGLLLRMLHNDCIAVSAQ